MPELYLPLTGSCRCGQIQIRVSMPPLLTMACHCKGCQRMTASAFSLSAAIPSEGFAVIRGAPVVGGLHGPQLHHFFCPHCMSWVFTRMDGMDSFVNVRATMLDDTSWYEPFVETWTREKLSWVRLPTTQSFEEFPPMDAYEGLTKDYLATAGSR